MTARSFRRVIFRTFLFAYLTSSVCIHCAHAQDICKTLQAELSSLISHKQDLEAAIPDKAPPCVTAQQQKNCQAQIAALSNQITAVQKQLDSNKCAPDPQTTPSALPLCCGWRVERNPRLVADLNADGKGDILAFGSDGVFEALSNGTGGSRLPYLDWQIWATAKDGA